MSYSDSEILCAYEKMQKLQKEYDFTLSCKMIVSLLEDQLGQAVLQ